MEKDVAQRLNGTLAAEPKGTCFVWNEGVALETARHLESGLVNIEIDERLRST
jgi:hypothetical protein